MKAFCLVCLYFDPQFWCLGYCREKAHYVHNPYKNCSKYIESGNVKEDPRWMIQWNKNALDFAEKRLNLITEFLQTLGELQP